MVLVAAVTLVEKQLDATQNLSGGDAALKAAQAGLSYAQVRLGEDPAWRGDANRTVIDSPDLFVVEDQGNVIGLIRSENGAFAQFRIRFNFQDDSADNAEDLPDPELWIDHPFVSVNNLHSGGAVSVPRADQSSFSVTEDSERPYTVPGGSVCVLVEGRAGPSLAALAPTNPNPEPARGELSTRVVEAYFRVNDLPGADASAQAAGNINVSLQSGVLEMKDKSSAETPRLRSKGDITVTGGPDPNLRASKGETFSAGGDLHADYDPDEVTPKLEDPNAGFYQLTWDDVKKAEGTDSLAAGTYVLWDDGTLHYYDMDYATYKDFIESNPTNGGTSFSLPGTIALDTSDPSKPSITISGDTTISPTGETDEFNLIPREGAQEKEGSGNEPPSDADEAAEQLLSASSGWTQTHNGTDGMRWQVTASGNTVISLSPNFVIHVTSSELYLEDHDGSAGGLAGALATLASNPSYHDELVELGTLLGVGGGDNGKLELPGVEDELRPDDIKVEFKPEEGDSAILSAEGNVRIGSNLKGEGGAVTSGGSIRIVGAGTDLTANFEDGINLYAREDIVLSSFKEETDGGSYKDFKLRGVIYAWGDITAMIGQDHEDVDSWGSFEVIGAVVAYGGDPAEAPVPGNGHIEMTAKGVKLEFDPAYLAAFDRTPPPGPLSKTFFTVVR